MRLFVLFDLPTKTKKDRSMATKFRNFLLKDGYNMLQYSIYIRVCKGQDVIEKHKKRLDSYIPSKGNIRLLQITETQYGKMQMLIGEPQKVEETGMKQLVLF